MVELGATKSLLILAIASLRCIRCVTFSGVVSWIVDVGLLRGGDRSLRLCLLGNGAGDVTAQRRTIHRCLRSTENVRQFLAINGVFGRLVGSRFVVQLHLAGLVQFLGHHILLYQVVAIARRPGRGMPRERRPHVCSPRTCFLLEQAVVLVGAKAAGLGLVHRRE